MTNDCKTCPVSTGTHKPAEAVHQIAEPQTDALDLADKLEKDVWQATPLRLSKVVELAAEALRAQSARIAELEKENSYLNNACAELEAQLEAIGAGGVEPLRKQAAQAVHQIAEPAAPVGKSIKDAIDALVMAAFTEGGCSEHRMSEARIQTELRKKELRTLLSTPQPCSRSHPHEEMTPMCELRTEIARLTNALARAEAQLAAAPQAVQPAVPEGWMLVPMNGTEEMARAFRAESTPALFYMTTIQCADFQERYRAMLNAAPVAPAHPAEGGQDFATLHAQLLNFLGADDHMHATRLIAGHMAREHELTNPTKQGLDAQDASVLQYLLSNAKYHEWDGGYRADFDISINADVNGARAESAKEAVQNILAAQAKQGGAA